MDFCPYSNFKPAAMSSPPPPLVTICRVISLHWIIRTSINLSPQANWKFFSAIQCRGNMLSVHDVGSVVDSMKFIINSPYMYSGLRTPYMLVITHDITAHATSYSLLFLYSTCICSIFYCKGKIRTYICVCVYVCARVFILVLPGDHLV